MRIRLLTAAITALFTTQTQAQPPGAVGELPEGPGKGLLQTVCFSCHTQFNIVGSAGYDTPDAWRSVFSTMVNLPDA